MRNVRVHNQEMVRTAEYRARQMRQWPSPLERKMMNFLEKHKVHYECQKIFYIYADDGWITRYYIADFYLPESRIIVEVDGKFHDKHTQADRDRTKAIQNVLPGVEVLRYKWKDLDNKKMMEKLLDRIERPW